MPNWDYCSVLFLMNIQRGHCFKTGEMDKGTSNLKKFQQVSSLTLMNYCMKELLKFGFIVRYGLKGPYWLELENQSL